jgi:hypothetical protein
MKKFSLLLAILLVAGTAYGQGTQINGTQIKDGTITDAKIAANASINYTKVNFTGAGPSIIGASNPLTFNTPLVRTSNAIGLTVVPVTLGGLGLTTIVAGRIVYGNSSTQAATSANLTFDSGTNAFTVTGSGHFTTTLTVGTTTSFNGKTYTWPSAFGSGSSGYVLTDATGNGTLSWAEGSGGGGVTLQANDPPDTQDTGGINISGKAFFGNSVHMKANAIYFHSDPTNINAYVKWDNTFGIDRMQIFGYRGVDIGSSWLGVAGLSVISVSEGAGQLIVTPAPFSTVTAGNVNVAGLVSSTPTITNIGTPGSSQTAYKIFALLADGTTSAEGYNYTATANATQDDTNYNNIAWAAVPGAYAYDIYRSYTDATSPTTTGKINTDPLTSLAFNDQGLAGDGNPIPENTTGIVTSRIFAVTVLSTGIATATTIAATGSIFHITDAATPIQGILLPYAGFVGSITLLPDAAFTTITGGNIALGTTAVIGKALIMTYDGSAWYPSY